MGPYYDLDQNIENSIAGLQEVIRAKCILVEARLDRLMQFYEKRSRESQGL